MASSYLPEDVYNFCLLEMPSAGHMIYSADKGIIYLFDWPPKTLPVMLFFIVLHIGILLEIKKKSLIENKYRTRIYKFETKIYVNYYRGENDS